MSDNPYGGKKPGCISLPLLILALALAVLLAAVAS